VNNLRSYLIALLLSPLCLSSATAEDWQFELSPYLWVAANKGESGTSAAAADIDIDFETLIENTDLATMVDISGHKDNLFFFVDFIYLDVLSEESLNLPFQTLELSVEITGSIIEAAAGYRLFNKNDFQLFGYAGIRSVDLDVTASIRNELSTGDDWVDPIVGIHTQWKLSDKFQLLNRFEAGGFGEGSEESYLINATLNHKLSDQWALKYFYRFLKVDYADNDFVYKMDVTGPGLAATYSF